MRPLSIAVMLAIMAPAVAGCAIPHPGTAERYTESHLLDWRHPTHGVPARAGFYAGAVIGTVGLTPLAIVDNLVTGKTHVHDFGGRFNRVSAHIGGGMAWVLGGPFYLLGMPFEPREERPPLPPGGNVGEPARARESPI